MKKLLFACALMLTIATSAQIKFEPLGGVNINLSKSQDIENYATGELIREHLPATMGMKGPFLQWRSNQKISYETIIGFRVNYKNIFLESVNTIYMVTNDFISNRPYLADFKLKLYYKLGKVKAGIEHLCIHKIESPDTGIMFVMRGGYTRISLTYNL